MVEVLVILELLRLIDSVMLAGIAILPEATWYAVLQSFIFICFIPFISISSIE